MDRLLRNGAGGHSPRQGKAIALLIATSGLVIRSYLTMSAGGPRRSTRDTSPEETAPISVRPSRPCWSGRWAVSWSTELPDEIDPPISYVDDLTGEEYIENAEGNRRLKLARTRIADAALPPQKSVDLIIGLAKE
ncbi:hypothetical protein [Actinoallomurus sp. NPDC052274]|uniref:hypothetical protein n=1 Tax=Actinoallomurus sp. NPDC052274 TaxID=3155420 RepID=UPI00343265E1